MISADVMRALAVAGCTVAEPCAACRQRREPTLESLLTWLVQHRQQSFELVLLEDGSWRATGRWPGPDRALVAEGRSPADAIAKLVLEISGREGAR